MSAATQTCPARSWSLPGRGRARRSLCHPSCPQGVPCSRRTQEGRIAAAAITPDPLSQRCSHVPSQHPTTGVQGTPVSPREALASALVTAFLLPAVH